MSISKEIERLQQSKKDIGDAIVRKGGSVSGTIDTYANSIMALGDVSFRTAIDIVNKSDAKNVDLTMISPKNETSLNSLFYNNNKLVSVDISNWDVSKVTTLRELIYGCSALTTFDANKWNTSNVTTMESAFTNCNSLTTLNISEWDTSNVTNMWRMFWNCQSINILDLSKWNTSNVTDAEYLFYNCRSLTTLNLSGWDMSKIKSMRGFFMIYYKLSEIRSDGAKLPNINLNNINLYNCPLTVDSIVGLLDALPQSDKGYSFQIGSDNIAKLSDDQKAIATNKGWTLI